MSATNTKLRCYFTEDGREVVLQDILTNEVLDYTGTGMSTEEIFDTLEYVYQLAKDGVDIKFEPLNTYEKMYKEMITW